MRRLKRPGLNLPTLVRVEDGRLSSGKAGEFRSHWNNADVRGALFAMSGPACSYCQSELSRGDRGDVDHFRPKNHYPWLAYQFENYLLACSLCNRTLKSDGFPLADGATRATSLDELPDEQRLLLDPAEDPFIDTAFRLQQSRRWYRLQPAESLTPGEFRHDCALETIHFFGLNDCPELSQARSEAVRRVMRWIDRIAAGETVDEQKQRRLRKRACRWKPHGIARQMAIRQESERIPDHVRLLPTEREEASWWINYLITDLQQLDGFITEAVMPRSRNRLKRRRVERLWSIAVAVEDPEFGELGINVEKRLQKNRLTKRLERYRSRVRRGE